MDIKKLVLVACIIVAITPGARSMFGMVPYRPNFETVRYIRSLKIKKPVNVLALDFSYLYFGMECNRVHPFDKDAAFGEFMRSKDINMVILTPRLKEHTKLVRDIDWRKFVIRPESQGFVRRLIPNTDRQVLIKRELFIR